MRVHELSKEMNIPNKILVEELNKLSIPAKNHMSALTEQQVKYFKNNYGKAQQPEEEKDTSKRNASKQEQ